MRLSSFILSSIVLLNCILFLSVFKRHSEEPLRASFFFQPYNGLSSTQNISLQSLIKKAETGEANSTVGNVLRMIQPPDVEIETSFRFTVYTSNKSQNPVCHLMGSCLTPNGSILLHDFLIQNLSTLQRCTISPIIFANLSSNNSQLQWSPYDLSGLRAPPSGHIPLFMDFFKTNLVELDIISDSTSKISFDICKGSQGEAISCDSNMERLAVLRLAHLVPGDVLGKSFSKWIPQFLSRLSKEWYIYSNSTLFADPAYNAVCFRSIMISKNTHRSDSMMVPKPALKSGLKEAPDAKQIRMDRVSGFSSSIQFTVLLVDRAERSSRRLGNRPEIIALINRLQSNCRVGRKHLKLHTRLVIFEDMSFLDQVRSVESADFIVGIHGAGLTNVLFAHPETVVIEIFPFLYYITFETLIMQRSLNYAFTVAEPHSSLFYECIAAYSIRNPAVYSGIYRWVRTLELWNTSKGKVAAPFIKLFDDKMEKKAGLSIRSCARSQTIFVDTMHLSELLQQALSNKLQSESLGALQCPPLSTSL